jgi:hypothetical protein
MKRVVFLSGLVLCVVLGPAVKSAVTAAPDPANLVKLGSLYEVSFCTSGRVVSDYSEAWPINIKVTGFLGDGWVEAEWGNSVKDGRSGKELSSYRSHSPQRFNLNAACAISQEIK